MVVDWLGCVKAEWRDRIALDCVVPGWMFEGLWLASAGWLEGGVVGPVTIRCWDAAL